MTELKYPIGIQTFSEMISEGWPYVDKTHYIPLLVGKRKYVFLSRPRRFGKSLFISTLEAYFEGRRDLFTNLALGSMNNVDWNPSPVLHFDFSAGVYDNPDGLVEKLHHSLSFYEERYGIATGAKDRNEIPSRFTRLIREVAETTGKRVVVLIDEYDKPLLGLEEDEETFDKSQTLLKGFFGNLKSMDRHIRFAFLTGVARFSKVSIFSDLNNLNDISLNEVFSDICGWTEDELLATFRPGIESLARHRGETFEITLDALRAYYDGYLFTPGGTRLYNPYSVLRALDAKSIDPYWFASGTPTFLVRRFRKLGIYPPDVNGEKCDKEELQEVVLNDSNPIPLMFQTGYLTIGRYDNELGMYELRFPNREVEIGFYRNLLRLYVPSVGLPNDPFNFKKFKADLHEGRPHDFMNRLASLLKDLPGEDHRESSYRAITYLLAVLSGTQAIAEHHGYKGRSDIEARTTSYVYLFEFKYDKSVKEAMNQIRRRDYAGRFAMDGRTVFLIGANFDSSKETRGLHYEIETLAKDN